MPAKGGQHRSVDERYPSAGGWRKPRPSQHPAGIAKGVAAKCGESGAPGQVDAEVVPVELAARQPENARANGVGTGAERVVRPLKNGIGTGKCPVLNFHAVPSSGFAGCFVQHCAAQK